MTELQLQLDQYWTAVLAGRVEGVVAPLRDRIAELEREVGVLKGLSDVKIQKVCNESADLLGDFRGAD